MKILFICYGNICRSPMAEMIFKNMIYKKDLGHLINVESKGISAEELGNDLYPKAKAKLIEKGIPIERHFARQVERNDYRNYDLIIAMEKSNIDGLLCIFKKDKENKIKLLLDKDIPDPWYTDDFESTYNDIYLGCEKLLKEILND